MANNRKVPVWIYGLVGVLLIAMGYRLMQRSPKGEPPDPRPGITAGKVLPASQWAAQPDVARVYAMAQEIPDVLDGLYCYCNCSKHSHHRSLLTCYESDHAAMCDICLGEAALAYKLAKQGKSLQEIRLAIDAQFG